MEYSAHDDYASKGVGTAGLTLGTIGTVLGSGILNGGLFNNGNSLAIENAQLKADAATDKKLVDVYTNLRALDKSQDKQIADVFYAIHVT